MEKLNGKKVSFQDVLVLIMVMALIMISVFQFMERYFPLKREPIMVFPQIVVDTEKQEDRGTPISTEFELTSGLIGVRQNQIAIVTSMHQISIQPVSIEQVGGWISLNQTGTWKHNLLVLLPGEYHIETYQFPSKIKYHDIKIMSFPIDQSWQQIMLNEIRTMMTSPNGCNTVETLVLNQNRILMLKTFNRESTPPIIK